MYSGRQQEGRWRSKISPKIASRKPLKALFLVSTLLQEAKHQTVRLLTRNQFIQQPSKLSESQICKWYPSLTFMHLADAFIQSDLQCIQVIHLYCQYVCSLNALQKNQGSTRVGYWLVITRLNCSSYKLSL